MSVSVRLKAVAIAGSLLLSAVSLQAREVFAWVQYGTASYTASMASFNNSFVKDGLTTISLQYWLVNTDGSLTYGSDDNDARVTTWVDSAHSNGKKIFMTLSTASAGNVWNPNVQDALLNSRAALLTNTLAIVNQFGLDGVDVDFEAGWRISSAEGLDAMDSFVVDLSSAMHALGKRVSVCTFAGRVYNFPNLSDFSRWVGKVDLINIMGYGETSQYAYDTTLHYTNIFDYCIGLGYDSTSVCIGLPGGGDNWHGYDLVTHLTDLLAIKPSLCIWNLALMNGTGGWSLASNWAIIKQIADYDATPIRANSQTTPPMLKAGSHCVKLTAVNGSLKLPASLASSAHVSIFSLSGRFVCRVDARNGVAVLPRNLSSNSTMLLVRASD